MTLDETVTGLGISRVTISAPEADRPWIVNFRTAEGGWVQATGASISDCVAALSERLAKKWDEPAPQDDSFEDLLG